MSIQNILKTTFNLDLPISGGDGHSISEPIIVGFDPNQYYIDMEYDILRFLFIWRGVRGRTIQQKLHLFDEKKIDELTIEITDEPDKTHIETFFMDVSEPYDLFEIQMADFFEAELKKYPNPNDLIQFNIIKR